VLRVESGDVDFRDQCIQGAIPFARGLLERAPEYWLKADRRLVPGYQDRALLWWSVVRQL